MSHADDISQLLANRSSLLLFIPIANFVYISQHSESSTTVAIGIFTALITAIVYTGVETPHDVSDVQSNIYSVGLIIWGLLLTYTAHSLYTMFNTEKYVPEGLFFITIMVISLILVDFLSAIFIEDYKGVLRAYNE